MDSYLIVGAGLSGLATAKFLGGSVIERGEIGGFFLRDDYPVNGIRGSSLVRDFMDAKMIRGTAFEANEEGIWVLSEEGSRFLKGIAIGANGFREKTLLELRIFGFRPAGIFPFYAAWELVNRGYQLGERVVIYGFNHYSLSLATKLRTDVTFIRGSGSLVHDEGEALDRGFNLIKGRVKRVEGKGRLEVLKIDELDMKADALILAELSPWNPLNLKHIVGNAAMIIEDPAKIVEAAKIFSESVLSNSFIEVISDIPCFPKKVASDLGRVIVGVGRGASLRVDGKAVVVDEPYPILEIPRREKVKIEVV
ncbi:MAG: hypothetical protein ACP5KE_04325 [Candidatus Methanodesulfokora sp.]